MVMVCVSSGFIVPLKVPTAIRLFSLSMVMSLIAADPVDTKARVHKAVFSADILVITASPLSTPDKLGTVSSRIFTALPPNKAAV
ncbi:hypothetical protein SDC9_189874 [bioreactor metagenome]|uniref:Uncharacterized protein n=1 Tax=bioreactor metagenome TaxID=1076179 RepID=A0A645HTM6_9ZZZZ